MKLSRFKITAVKSPGYMMVVYEDGHFKSILNEFKPPLSELQLNLLLNRIPDNPDHLMPMINEKYAGRILVEKMHAIGDAHEKPLEDMPPNMKIALFCEFFEAKTKVKYKVSPADSGKVTHLRANAKEWENLLQVYFDSNNFLFKNKYSISNIAKYWNELRVEALGEPVSNFPIPYSQAYFKTLDLNGQRAYWTALRAAGYTYVAASNREGKWVKKSDLINQ